MTPQEIFDKVVNHLRKQGVESMSQDGACMYRGHNGTKCAVGCLIKDEEYNPSMEYQTLDELINSSGLLTNALSELFSKNIHLLSHLQQTHDRAEVCEWEQDFEAIAHKFNLVYTPPAVR